MLKPDSINTLQIMLETMGHRERLVFKSCIDFDGLDIKTNLEVYSTGRGDKQVIKVSVVDEEGNVIRYKGKNQITSKRLNRWKWSNYEKLFDMIAPIDTTRFCFK